ncbi:hypothetical protein AXG93_2931s1080 [Marchantia polymorpha subsp. ruderalis]|uniref:Major facilitator superfamily (MFS) profile domain-containing protein n=1 Tax=Marchantia polymorpha subsp. ruderalis TaxID=1480154 RepID=A0A176VY88_MARPO|nr:hypothetical protein AXG93_2931s1080 [Marchantia polymorpha subsp. ruderalis]
MGLLSEGERHENEVPLLENLYPDCPGCKCAYLSAKGAGPPVKELFMITMIVICNALPISSLFPFLYFMVDDFHIADKKEDIGYYAGAVGSVFMFGRFLSSVPWGMFADRFGRRPVFALGLLSVIVFQLIFGATKSFWVAFAARFMLGLFNGMLGPLKAYASEVCNEENQAWGLSTVSTSWSLGLIIGPAMGGFLARPAMNFPSIFAQDSFFGRYPYLLPSIIQAIFAVAGLFVVYFMPETVHKHDNKHLSDDERSLIKSAKAPKEPMWKNKALMASIAVYCVWCFMEISFSEVFSLWCVSPREVDGLGLPTSDVGMVLAVSGASVFVFNMTVFPIIAKYLGPILVTRVPAPTDQRGAANGLSLSCVSLFRTIGPAGAGAIFAWGQSRHDAKFLPGSQLVFAVMEIFVILAIFTTFPPILPVSANRPYYLTHPQEEKEDDDEAR